MPCGLFPHAPGSQAGFLPLRPLRTARASVPSSRSSLANAPCGARWCHVSLLALDLPGAGGVQEDTVGRGLPAPMRAPDPVMVVPSCASGALLGAHRTETVWLLPQGPQVPAAFEGVCHLHAEAFFAGPFPLGVIRVCCACEFDLPVHGHVPCTTEREVVGVPLGTRACPHEGPLASVVRANVLLRHPSARRLWGPPCGPGPQTPADGCLHCDAGGLAHHVAVRVCPPAHYGLALGH